MKIYHQLRRTVRLKLFLVSLVYLKSFTLRHGCLALARSSPSMMYVMYCSFAGSGVDVIGCVSLSVDQAINKAK